MVPLSAYVAVSAVLFITGVLGVVIRRNFIIVLMSVEIMLNAANINLVAFSYYLESMAGQLVALFIIAIAAGEAAIGLAIIIVVFRGKISTNVDEMNLLKCERDRSTHQPHSAVPPTGFDPEWVSGQAIFPRGRASIRLGIGGVVISLHDQCVHRYSTDRHPP